MIATAKMILAVILALFSVSIYARTTSDAIIYEPVKVKAFVLDSKTAEPIPYASVYLIPKGDTTVTNFTISDANGKALMDNVTPGQYELNAEHIGYFTFKKVFEISSAPGWDLDLGTIGLEENMEQIDAASITVAGHPIMIQNDTIYYSASSYTVGENAMLEDLLKKMPGMTVGSDGSVSVNGEKVSRITVGGRTFFFDDPSVALKNMPAKIVERIKVSKQTSKEEQMQGISTEIGKETVMDVEIKEEYKKGWFGNAKLGGGAILTGKNDNPLTEDTKGLYEGNAMLSGYGEKDQVVLIANAFNDAKGSTGQTSSAIPEDDFTGLEGILTAVQAGANYNTSRINHFETTVSAIYKHRVKDDRKRFSRTSFTDGADDFLTDGGSDAVGKEDLLSVALEASKQDGKLLVEILPRFNFRKSSVSSSNFSTTSDIATGSQLNSLSATSFSNNGQFFSNGYIGVTGKDLGKTGRRAGFSLNYSGGLSDGNENDNSLQNLNYEDSKNFLNLDGKIFYYEPLGRRWGMQATFGSIHNSGIADRDAFDIHGTRNDFYTSFSSRKFNEEYATVLMQYSNDTSTVQFGVRASARNDMTHAVNLERTTVTGRNAWKWDLSPVMTYSHCVDGSNFSLQYSGGASPVSSQMMIPSPDITDPMRIMVGNIYLKSGFRNNLMAYYDYINYSTYTFLTAYVQGDLERNGAVYASWFDTNGTRYAVPVNSGKPNISVNAYALLNQPFGREKNFTFSFSGQFGMNRGYSYQAEARMPGIDLVNFDYQSFMGDFWGNADGDRFYSGVSGFKESLTRTYDWGADVRFKYNNSWFTGTVFTSAMNSISRYSLDKTANMNIWTFNSGTELLFTFGKGWEIGNKLSYVFYRGFSDGFGTPELRWDMNFSKTVKSVTFALKLADIFNQTNNLTRTVSAEFVEDRYSNVLGRTLLLSLSFNFGKINQDKTAAVSKGMKQFEY